MSNGINMSAIFIADLMGIVLTTIMLIGSVWRFRNPTRENRDLLALIITVLISCAADTVSFYYDGKPGLFARIVVISSNTWLYWMNIVSGLFWLGFLSNHLHVRLGKTHRTVLTVLSLLFSIPLAVNLFVPIVFTVNENNVYARTNFFLLYLVLDTGFLLDGLVLYLRTGKTGGVLKFFPVWLFIVPVFLSFIIQCVFYGVSTIWPFIAISIAGILVGLQNELVFRDPLTGLYNRYYLDYLKQKISRKETGELTAMMLDLNGFKEINDRYGHKAGDEALMDAAGILNGTVGALGTVIRYAGDEFIILLNTTDPDQVRHCQDDIRRGMDAYNLQNNKDFSLSASIGCCPLDLRTDSVQDFLGMVDRKMYEDKRSSANA